MNPKVAELLTTVQDTAQPYYDHIELEFNSRT